MQREAALMYAATHNLRVVGESSDIGSGLVFNHPGLLAMLAAVKSGRIFAVIIKDVSRIGRNAIKTHDIIANDIGAYGVMLHCYSHPPIPRNEQVPLRELVSLYEAKKRK